MNKTNKQAKYNQRHGNKEQIDTNQSAGVVGGGEEDNGGKQGRGHQGTCIKDPWAKPKGGRTEGGKWGWIGWRKAEGRK